MNDSKWQRLIAAIEHVVLPVSFWKFLDSDREYKTPTPTVVQIVTYGGRRGIGDSNACGPFYFRDVETVRWPAEYSREWFRGLDPVNESQPIDDLSQAIDNCGLFNYTRDCNGLVLHAY